MGQHYSGQALVVKNPYVPFAVAMAGCGALAAVLCAVVILQDLGGVLATLHSGHVPPLELIRALRLLVAAGWALWGLNALLTGLRHLGSVYSPPGAPRDFAQAEEVLSSLMRQDLPVYRLPDRGALALARRYFSDLVPWLTERPRMVIEENVAFARKVLLLTVGLLLAAVALSALDVHLRGSYFPGDRPGFPVLLLVLLWLMAVVKVASLFFMLPNQAPSTDVIEERPSFRGAGNPFNLPGVIETALLPFRWREIPNRCHRSGFTQEQGGVSDTGVFRGTCITETQPVPYDTVPSPAVAAFIGCGVPLLIIGLWYSCLAPLPKEPSGADLAYQVVVTGVGVGLAGLGRGFLRHAHWLLGSFRFSSLLLLFRVEGSFAKGEARLGRGALDTAEAGVVDVRSDGQCEVYACRAVSESYTLEGARHLIGLVWDEEVPQLVTAVREAVARFENERVAMRAPDLQRAEAAELENVNQRHMGVLGTAALPPMVPPPPATPLIDAPVDPPAAERVCPHCAETVPDDATVCPHCDEALPLLPGPDEKLCPHCGGIIKRAASKCKHCKLTVA